MSHEQSQHPNATVATSPRRFSGSSSSPRPPHLTRGNIPSRLPSFSESDPRTNVVLGFSPPSSAGLPSLPEQSTSGSPRPTPLALHQTNYKLAHLSPQLSTPVEQSFNFFTPDGSPRHTASSPRAPNHADLIRSRRNSAAIVSISLSSKSRSRSRTPRGAAAALPSSGQATPSKGSNTVTPKGDELSLGKPIVVQMANGEDFPPATGDQFDDWQPTGGLLLDDDESDEVVEDHVDERHDWAIEDDDERLVEDVLAPGMLFGEGLEFQGEVVEPAVGKLAGDPDVGMPLRRGGSEAPKALRGQPGVHIPGKEKKVFEVIRQLGSGSYAVVYLVREKGGRKREYALKCLSKQDLEEEQIETQLFEATIHLSLPIHKNIVTLHQTLQTKKWLFLMLELCPGEDLFYWLEKSRDASPPPVNATLPNDRSAPMSSSKFSSSSIPFSSSQLFSNLSSHSFTNSPNNAFSPGYGASPASLLFAHNNNNHHSPHHFQPSQTPPTPSLLSAFSANTLLSSRRLRLIASMFSQMCEAVAICHDAGVSHRDIKPENFICCDSIELESAADGEMDFGPQAKRKVVVKLTDFGLATTEEESGDVECGSKPYMSYECRNNLGPTYYPPAADVWSLGIVLINMLFHRNPWKDPTEGDVNFDNFLRDPTSFLLSKFTGIGREVASYLACHVLCTEVEDRVTARDFGSWIKALPDMIGGRKAVRELKMARLETRPNGTNGTNENKSLFVKSPVLSDPDQVRKTSASALTSSAPMLSSLPLPTFQTVNLPTPGLDMDLDTEIKSATTVDEQPTPADISSFPSPETPANDDNDPELEGDTADIKADDDSRSLSTHKRRKRGVRKGKAAQAALAAAAAGGDKQSQEERDAMLRELADASQTLARNLSKHSRPPSEIDPTDTYDFPPLGTTPSQIAAAKKSKWKDLMKMSGSSANPELAALARRVAERDSGSIGNWSAPAKLQHDPSAMNTRSVLSRPHVKQTQTVSTVTTSSALSSFGQISSTTSSSADDDEDWRARPPRKATTLPTAIVLQEDQAKKDEADQRTKNARLAAAAITGLEPMGAFGANRPPVPGNPGHPRRPNAPLQHHSHQTTRALHTIADDEREYKTATASTITSSTSTAVSGSTTTNKVNGFVGKPPSSSVPIKKHDSAAISIETASTASSRPTLSSVESSASTILPSSPPHRPDRPKLKGQIQSLAKMLSGLKTKGKD